MTRTYFKLGMSLQESKALMRLIPCKVDRSFLDILVRTIPYLPQALQKRVIRRILTQRYTKAKGHAPSLTPPRTFNEHILHRIIEDRDPRLKILCDKLAVRRFIGETAGEEFLVPLLGVWSSAREIAWDRLPSAFVLKPNHSSGRFALVRSAEERDTRRLTQLAESWLAHDYFHVSLEWGYLGLPRRILAEPLLRGPDGGQAMEVQIQTVRGKTVQIGLITGERGKPERFGDWFYPDGTRHPGRRRQPLRFSPLPGFVHAEIVPVAESIARGFDQLRVDFFVTADGLKIGELTAYSSAGRSNFDPPELDAELGQLWTDSMRLGPSRHRAPTRASSEPIES